MIKNLLLLILCTGSSYCRAMVPGQPKPHMINKTMATALLARNSAPFPENTLVYEKHTKANGFNHNPGINGYYHHHNLNSFFKHLTHQVSVHRKYPEFFDKNIQEKQALYCPAGSAQKEPVIIYNTSDCSECDKLREYLVWYNSLVD